MTLLRRYRRMVYVHNGDIRELALEDWADADGVIETKLSINILGRVPEKNRGANRRALARLDSIVRAAT